MDLGNVEFSVVFFFFKKSTKLLLLTKLKKAI